MSRLTRSSSRLSTATASSATISAATPTPSKTSKKAARPAKAPSTTDLAPAPKKRKLSPQLSLPLNPQPHTAYLPPSLTFDLPVAIAHLTAHDARFARLFAHVPCRPFVPPYKPIDPFRTLVTSIVGQQVSWMAARAINGRFRALFGYPAVDDKDHDGFPAPREVAASDIAALKGVGLSTRKAEYVIALAEHFVSGQLSTDLFKDGTDDEVAKALIAVRGIGQWTVDMFLIFSLRRPDVLPVGDLGVQKGLLRWALAAHGALPRKAKTPKKTKSTASAAVDASGSGEIDTARLTPPPDANAAKKTMPGTPATPAPKIEPAVIHAAGAPAPSPITPLKKAPNGLAVPHTPSLETPGKLPAETLEAPSKALPPPAPEWFLDAPSSEAGWDAHRAAPLTGGLSVPVLRERLNGKKVKGGAYLTPAEMEILTESWKPYRSLGVIYTWSVAEDI